METPAILLEAEAFDSLGGWLIDQQFMDVMGSPFLLAHGLGRPVDDAVTTMTPSEAGDCRVWVRTRDWVGPWKTDGTPEGRRASGNPGAFQVLINGTSLDTTFGVEGAEWHWQDGGIVHLDATVTTVSLHDLTGCDGRCDAIYLTQDLAEDPTDRDSDRSGEWRGMHLAIPPSPLDAGDFDLVVVGAGIAGVSAALAAARRGVRVALVHDRPVVGGNNSSEVRVWLGGATQSDRFPGLGRIVEELEPARRAHTGPENSAEIYEDDKRADLLAAEGNIEFFAGLFVNEVETDSDRIVAVTAQNVVSAERLRFRARWFADCTGDGTVGYKAGADFEMTRTGHLGPTNMWNVADTGQPVAFPRCRWALDLSGKPFPGRGTENGIKDLGAWFWESGFDHDPIEDAEAIRDWNFRAIYGAWDCLKNEDNAYPNHQLNWMAYIAGKRESRRLLGDMVLTKDDVMAGRAFDDGCVITGWSLDLHYPDERYEKGFEGDAFISRAEFISYPMPFHVPYRCFYSRNVTNLFMAGRNVSVTHEALGTVRVMRTCGLMGEAVGMAAALCKRRDTDPRGVYEDYLADLIQMFSGDE